MFQMFADFAVNMVPFKNDLRQAKSEAERFTREFEQTTGRSTGTWGKIGNAIKSAFGAGTKASKDFFKETDNDIKKLERSFEGLHQAARGVMEGITYTFGAQIFGLIGKGVDTFKGALFGLNNEMEGASARINAFTKDQTKTNEILKYLNAEAAKTPFAFAEMATAVGSLLPITKSAGVSIEDLVKQAEILAASNPMQGLEGASFALREALTGDFTSIIERFNLSRVSINKWKNEGVSNFEIVQRALKEAGYDFDLVSKMGETLSGRWSTFKDTIDNLLRTLTSPLFEVLKTWLIDIQKLLDAGNARFTALAETIGEKIAAGAKRGWAALVDLAHVIDGLLQKAKDFRTGFTGAFGDAVGRNNPWVNFGISAKQVFEDIRGYASDAMEFIRAGIEAATQQWDKLQERIKPGDMGKKGGGLPELPGGLTGKELGVAAGGVGLAGLAGAGGIAAVGLAIAPLMPLLGPLISGLGSLAGVLGSLALPLAAVAVAAGGLYVAWQTNFLGIRDVTNEAIGQVKTTLDNAGPMWDQFVANSAARLDEWKKNAQATFGEFAAWFQSDVQPRLQDLGGVWSYVLGSMKDTAIDLGNTLIPRLEQVRSSFETFGTVVSGVLEPVIRQMRDDLGPAIQEVLDFANANVPLLARAWQNVASIIGPVIANILTLVRNLIDTITMWVIEHRTEIVAVFSNIWDQIKAVIGIAWEIVTGLIRTGLLILSGDWSGAWNEIKDTAADVWNQIVAFFTAGFDNFKIIVGGAMDWVHQKITDRWNDIKLVYNSVTDEIRTKLDSWSDGIKTKLDTWSEAIGKTLLRPFEAMRDSIEGIGRAIGQNLASGFKTGIDAMNSFGGGVSKVINWIGNALGKGDVVQWSPIGGLARGTQNWGGGWAWVGEGNGGSGAELAYLPPGAKVIPHEQSMEMVRKGAVPGFAGGLGIPNPFDIFKNGPDWLLQQAMSAIGVTAPAMPGKLAGAGDAFFQKVKEWLGGWVAEFVKKALPVSTGQIQAMINFAESQAGLPYIYGGGHGGGLGGPGIGFDCSGFVAAVLDAGGIPNPHGIVTAFYEWMQQGRTGIVDIGISEPYADPRVQHTGIGLMGQWYESGGITGGAGRTADYFPIVGHPPGWDKAAAGGSLDNIDVESSLKNMRRGVRGQWSQAPRMFARGGVITETVVGLGQTTGRPYMIGEAGPEAVIPLDKNGTGSDWRQAHPYFGPDTESPGEWFGALATVLTEEIEKARTGIAQAISTQTGDLIAFWSSLATGGSGGGGTGGGGGTAAEPAGDPTVVPGGLRPRYYGRGTNVARDTASSAARPSGMVSSKFPEPVIPDPNAPGERWVGTLTGTVYGKDGQVILAGTYNDQRGPVGMPPGGLGGGQPQGGGPPPVYPWGLDPQGKPKAPWQQGIGGGYPGGEPKPGDTTIRLEIYAQSDDGKELAMKIVGDPDGLDLITAGSVTLMNDIARRR